MAGLLQISVQSSAQLQNTLLLIRQANKDIQGNIRRYTKAEVMPEWQSSLAQHAETLLEHRVLVDTATVSMSNQNVRLTSANKGGKLSGGLQITSQYGGVEFGADRAAKTTYRARSKNGKSYEVTRRTHAQFRPTRRNGYVVYQTATEEIPRYAAMFVQTALKTIHDAVDGKAG